MKEHARQRTNDITSLSRSLSDIAASIAGNSRTFGEPGLPDTIRSDKKTMALFESMHNLSEKKAEIIAMGSDSDPMNKTTLQLLEKKIGHLQNKVSQPLDGEE